MIFKSILGSEKINVFSTIQKIPLKFYKLFLPLVPIIKPDSYIGLDFFKEPGFFYFFIINFLLHFIVNCRSVLV